MIFEKKNSSFTYTLFFLTYKALIAQKNQSVKERSIFFFQISKFGSFWWVVVPDKQQKVENFYFTWHESLWLGRIILVKHIPNIDIIYLGCFYYSQLLKVPPCDISIATYETDQNNKLVIYFFNLWNYFIPLWIVSDKVISLNGKAYLIFCLSSKIGPRMARDARSYVYLSSDCLA